MASTVRLELLNLYGARTPSLKGVDVSTLFGASGIGYTPRGAIVSAQGSLKFRVPMDVRKNIPLDVDTMVRVVHSRYGDEGVFVVNDKSETLAEGGHFADFDCPDQTEELRWGMASVESDSYYDGVLKQAVVRENTSHLAQRIVAWQQETYWSVAVSSEADGYYSTPFSAYNLTPIDAIGQICSQRRASWKLGANRTIMIGRFGLLQSGIRLNQYSRRPDKMRNGRIVGINTITPKADAGSMITCIVPMASGSGSVQITLREAAARLLFQPVTAPNLAALGWQVGTVGMPNPVDTSTPYWAGYDPAYPVYRRPVPVTTNSDGWEYFLYDPAARTYRQRWYPYVAQNLTPVTDSPLDVAAVSQSLYIAGLTYLTEHNAPHRTFDVETNGFCDVRGIGGTQVRVNIKSSRDGLDSLKVNADYQVVDVERVIDDDTGADTLKWTVSNLGRRVEDNNSVMVGLLQDVANMQLNPVIFPSRMWLNFMDDVDPANPTSFVIPGDKSISARVQALLTIKALPMRSTVLTTAGGTHTHVFDIPALTVNIPSLSISVSGGNHKNGTISSTGHSDHTISPGAHTNSIVSTPVFIDPKHYGAVKTAAYGKNGETVVTDVQAFTTTDSPHTHGTNGQSGGATYTTNPSAGNGGGFNIDTAYSGDLSMAQTIAATTSSTVASSVTHTGGMHNHDVTYGIYLNTVNGSVVMADYLIAWMDTPNNPSAYLLYGARTTGTDPATGLSYPDSYTVDIAAKINDQQDHTIYVASTIGRVQVMMNVRQRESTVGVGITG